MPTIGKTVWVIGAGASRSHAGKGFPTLMGLPAAASELGLVNPKLRNNVGDYPDLETYVRNRFGLKLGVKKPALNLENVLTILDIDVAVRRDAKLVKARDDLVYLLWRTILDKQRMHTPTVGDYHKLADRLRQRDTIITFNWDSFLDDCCGRQKIFKDARDSTVSPQYRNFWTDLSGFGEQIVKHIAPAGPYITWSGDRGYLLKTHGSIDWFHCENDACRGFGRVFPTLLPEEDFFCGNCHEKLALTLVPPTLNKQLRAIPVIRRIWSLAAQEMKAADQIVIWGYSLPPTDFFSQWLLQQTGESCTSLVVINPTAVRERNKVKQVDAGFLGRMAGPFKRSTQRVSRRVFEYFKDWLQDLSVDRKYPHLRDRLERMNWAGRKNNA